MHGLPVLTLGKLKLDLGGSVTQESGVSMNEAKKIKLSAFAL